MVLESNTLDVLFVKDGQQGEDGKVLYTWIKYAKDANGTGMTDDPNGAIYIGISYNNESSIESNDPTQYAWTKIQGADGKKGEDAYTIFLENENISFATDKNRNPLSEQAYTSGITIMKGAKPVTDFIIGDIAKTQGIAVAKTDTAIAISVVNGNPLPNDSGEIEIPIIVGGTVFKKILTWTCAKKGDQGEQGERGLQGIQGPQGIQGVAGKDGTNGKTAYFHIKYSSVANPTSSSQLTETPSTYIGTYVDFTETDSTDPKKYTWSQFVGSQGPKGEQGIAGVGVDGKTSYLHIAYANSADGKTGFSTSDSTNKSYIGQYTDFTPNDSTDYTKYSWSLIRGKDGTDGVSPTVSVIKNGKTTTITITDKNGTHTQTVRDGTDGTPGQTGKDGKTTYFHVKYSNDGGQTFTSNSGEDVGAYIGTCTDYNQADPTTVGAYTWARIKGEKGDQGVRGEKGKDGTSVTITNKSITYQLSTSGTTIPTGTWQTSPQTIPEGQYQWTKTSVTYSDGNKTESYSISYHGKNGSNGTSVKTTSTSVKYQVGDSGTTKPTGTWQANVPTVVQGKYLWTQTIVNYSDGNSTESYSVAYRGIDGNNGVNGMNAATIYLYQRATSTPNKPSNTLTYTFSTTKITGTLNNGWSTAIPTGTDAVYVTVASVSSKNDTATIATSAWSAPVVLAQNGKTGSDGKAGLNVATIYLYQRNTSKPSKPSASITYTFSTGVASGLNNGWSQKIPDGTNPLYVTLATASSNTATDTILSSEWSDVVVMAQNGEDGQDGISPKVTLSKSGDTTTISIVDATGTHTQTIKDGTNGTPGAAGKDGKTSYFHVKYSNDGGKTFTGNSGEDTGIYMGSYTDYTEADSTDVSKYTWVKVKGDKGDTGQKGDNAKNLSITPSSQYFKSTDGGKTFAPNTITIKPTIQGEINFGKWQYSIDGGVSFADVVNRQKGLTISNNVLTVSRDSSLYSDAVTMVTFRAVASDSSFYDTCSIAKIYDVSDIQIGGRNLAKKGCIALWDDSATFNDDTFSEDGSVVFSRKSAAANSGVIIDRYVNYEKDEHYIVSFKMRVTSGTVNSFYLWNGKGHTNNSVYVDGIKSGTLHADVSFPTDDQYHQITAYFTATGTTSTEASDIDINHHLILQPIKGTAATYTVQLLNFKIEKGNKATDWTPAPEDVQTAILSTKSEISDVSLKVDKNKQAIEQRVEKTTYQQDLNLIKGDISKANEGLNKWRYEIYPKSLFTDKPDDQRKISLDVFARNKNIIPTQSILLDDTKLGQSNYDDNYIGYAVTFVKMSEATKLETTFVHDDAGSFYLNGKLICTNGTNNFYSSATPDTVSCTLVKGWNCLEVVINEGAGSEGFKFGTVLSQLSTCQLMNCYYAMVTGRESQITNTLVQNTIDIEGVSTKVGKVTSIIGEDGKNFTDFKNDYSDFKQTMNGFKTTVGQTYVTKDDFDGLEIGGVNLFVKSTASRGWWIRNTGVLNADGGWGYSDYIDVSGMKNYIASGFTNLGISPATCFYDSNKTFISGVASKNQNSQDSKRKTLPIPSNAKYMRFSFALADIDTLKIEQGTKATAYSPAPEDDVINGQNLVSNLSSNWEQGSVSYVANSTYASIKTVLATRLRTEDVFSVSGNVTISADTSTNSSKEELNFYYVLFDVNKKAIGVPASGSEWQSLTSPKIINCGDAQYMAIILRWGSGSTVITPSDISQICLKIERGTSATPFTLAPEDVNGKIVNAETIANQTANKFSWIVKSGTSSSNFEITDRLMNLVSANINLDGIVSFMNTAKGEGRKNLYNLDYSNFENVASQEDAICYAKDNGVTSVGIDSSVSYDGDKSLKISYTTANLNSSTTPLYLGSSANNYGCVKIQAGKQYILSCYVKSDSTTGLFMIDIQGHDTPDTKTDGLYLSNIDPRKLPGSSTGVNLSTDWQRAICAIKVADNATGLYWSVVPLIWGKPSSSNVPQTFNVWVDCIMLEEVDSISNEPGTYILDKKTIIDGGSVKADTITGNQILAGSITADKIATDAIKSHNYISSGGTQGSFLNLGDGSFTSPNLSWDSNGNLIAKNANLSGQINATKGTVGGWNIATNGLYSGIDENAIKIYSATTYDAQTMYQKQKIQDSFILSQKYINHFVSQQVSVGHNIPYWQTRSFIYNDSQIQLAQSDYCINTSSASNYDAQYSLKDGYISATRIYMEQNITQVGGDVINSSFSIGLDSMMGWCSIQSTKGINIYGNSSRALYVQSNDTSKYNALETEGDVVVNGKIHAVSGDNKIQLNSDNNGSIELYGNTPFIDFHSAYSSADYTCRIIANTPEQLLVCGKLRCDSNIISNNDLIANSWVYAGQNAHYTWQNQLDCYFSCGYYNNTNNVYYYAGYHAFYVNNDSGSGMMYINTNGVTSRVGFTKTSDERIKKNFESFDDNIIDAYMNIEPVKYQLKQSSNDNYHFGFKAQHVDKVFSDYGDTYNESFDICTSRPIDPDKAKELYGVDDMTEEYGLRYDELIAPTTYMVQHIYKELESTKGELAKVKQEKADLETRLQAIEAKLRL